MKKKLLIVTLLLSINCIAQFSKTHYIPPLASAQTIVPVDQYLYISTPSLEPVNFRIIGIGGNDVIGVVSRDQPYEYLIGSGPNTQLNVAHNQVNQILNNKGYIIEAEDLIYVSARIIAGDGNHAGKVVSKGLAALGTQFRIGGLLNTLLNNYGDYHYTFVSILATENNTEVSFSDIGAGAVLTNNVSAGSFPSTITLNSGQSFVMAVEGPTNTNRDALIGSLVSSNKPIAVNCGSFGGSNGALNNVDLGFDQIVSAERTGKDYIFIKSTGQPDVEKVLIIAHEDDTEVFLGAETTPIYTIDAGEYVTFDGNDYTPNGNLFVRTSKNTFAYQSIGDDARGDQANQEMFFVPPLSCQTPKNIDNIPFLERVGGRIFDGRVSIITETGSTLTFVVNGTNYTLANLPGVNVDGPLAVEGNTEYETYVIKGLSGNVSVLSTGQLYLASYGSNDAATFGGFYSGFTFKPEVTFDRLDTSLENCIPNVELSVSTITAFDEFQWFFNDVLIPGATNRDYTPTQPGYYHISATISDCGTVLISDKIPVSSCATDSDNDGANDNIDVDSDNDGITNCAESLGDRNVVFAGTGGTISAPGYANSFVTSFPPASGTPTATPFTGNSDGSFVTSTSAGNGNSTVFELNFAQPVSISLEYPLAALPENLITSQSKFIISVPVNRTITVLNPTDQLLIDTNYDGIYESGITEFSSFEIRFRLKSTTPLPAGTGTFSFRANLADNVRFTQVNLNDAAVTNATFSILATCVPIDRDGDGIPDQNDLDSDNDGIPDFYESQGMNFFVLSGIDINSDGLDDIFENGFIVADSDADGVPDYLDLDSDNNGIFDLTESGLASSDGNNNGIIDGNPASFGNNGLSNSVETFANSGITNLPIRDTDADGIFDFVEADNDNDQCSDVLEAGFTDGNNNGYLGNAAIPIVDGNGLVTGAPNGYTMPNSLYIVATPIDINDQPEDMSICEGRNAVFAITTNPGVSYQWQLSSNGITFTNINDNATFSGATTSTLTINAVTAVMSGNQYRVQLYIAGNICGSISESATLTVLALPATVTRTLVQCDTGISPDGITLFNLAQADEMFIAGDSTFSVDYFLSVADADAGVDPLPLVYTNITNPQQLVARVTTSANSCFTYSTLNLVANLLPSQIINVPSQCDDDGTEDGLYEFNLTQTVIPVPSTQTIRYYENETDALLEQNAILNPTQYVNLIPYSMQVVARVENETAESCTRLYFLNLTVNALPAIFVNEDLEPFVVCVNSNSFTTVLEPEFLDGSDYTLYDYQWFYEGQILTGATSSSLTVSAEGLYSVEVTDANGCSKIAFIPVIASSQAIIQDIAVTDLSFFNTVTVTLTSNSYGDYVYSLDVANAFQESNIFQNVAAGTHVVFVKDKNGCPITSQMIYVMGIPKYFTPNGDGFNDVWNLRGASPSNGLSIIYIFDRYGKLITQIIPAGEGWDGSLNGHPLPSDDYWYSIFLTDGRAFKGHFTLKR